MRRGLVAVLVLALVVTAVGLGQDGHWLRAGLFVLLGGATVGAVARRPAADEAPPRLTDNLAGRVADLLGARRRTAAVRLVRRETGAGLVAAARAVDGVRAQGSTRPS